MLFLLFLILTQQTFACMQNITLHVLCVPPVSPSTQYSPPIDICKQNKLHMTSVSNQMVVWVNKKIYKQIYNDTAL